ncbi:hypothetical protein EV426DRAFT_71058 [Tirmania nivea]|nr:hypothetical protein EV426DRAFT_71058 [Tirmania nivea]
MVKLKKKGEKKKNLNNHHDQISADNLPSIMLGSPQGSCLVLRTIERRPLCRLWTRCDSPRYRHQQPCYYDHHAASHHAGGAEKYHRKHVVNNPTDNRRHNAPYPGNIFDVHDKPTGHIIVVIRRGFDPAATGRAGAGVDIDINLGRHNRRIGNEGNCTRRQLKLWQPRGLIRRLQICQLETGRGGCCIVGTNRCARAARKVRAADEPNSENCHE